MATDVDILKTLQRIEGLIKNQSSSTPSGNNSTRAKIAGGGALRPEENAVVGKKGKVFKAVAKGLEGVSESADDLNKSFGKLNKTVDMTRANFVAMNRQMRSTGRAAGNSNASVTPPPMMAQSSPQPVLAASTGFNRAMGRMTRSVTQTTTATSSFGGKLAGLTAPLTHLGAALKAAINDAFFFSSRGLSAGAGFNGLYMDAIRAGMGVREYTQSLSESMPAVLRSESLNSFGKSLDVTRNQLAGLGIFGEEATKTAMSLATNNTILGVSQSQMEDANRAQVNSYNEIRKSTLMTAAQFRSLTAEIAENADVQQNMIGVGQSARIARQGEIVQIMTLGQRLGATEKASKALGEAMLAQRKASVETRFRAQGLVRQAGAMFGMRPGDAERMGQLARKKNLTADEAAEAQGYAKILNERLQQAQDSGNVYMENMAEQMLESFSGTNMGAILSASGAVGLAQDSGEIKSRKEFGKGANDLMQGAGKLLAYASGLSKSPFGMAIVGAIASAVGLVFAKSGIAGIGGLMTAAVSGISKVGTAIATGVKAIPSLAGRAGGAVASLGGQAWGGVKSAAGMASNALSAVWDMVKKPVELIQKGKGVVTAGVQGVSKAMSSVSTFFSSMITKVSSIGQVASKFVPTVLGVLKKLPVVGSLISAIVGGVTEVFTGDFDSAFNEAGGTFVDRIGNTIFATINSIFGSIFDLVDGVIKFFGGDGLNLRNAFDKFSALMRGGFFTALAGIAKAVTFGSDNKLSNYFTEAADNSFKVLDQLSEDQSATIASLGAENGKKMAEQKKAAKETVDTMNNSAKVVGAASKVVSSTTGLTSSVLAEARQVATPITPPIKMPENSSSEKKDVNNNSGAPLNPTQNTTTSSSQSEGNETSQVVTLLQEMVNLLKSGNVTAETQAEAINMLSRGSRAAMNATDNTVLFERLMSRN